MSKLRISLAALAVSAMGFGGMAVVAATPAGAAGYNTTLTCHKDVTPSGAKVLRCTATDPNGVGSVVSGGVPIFTSDCTAHTPSSFTFTLPRHHKQVVNVTDCGNIRQRAKFVIRTDNTVHGPTYTFV
jgi:hypothetical protein